MTTYLKFLDAIAYISQNVSSRLANDIMQKMSTFAGANNFETTVTTHLAGVSTAGAGVYVSNGAARRTALRALLLCQAIYLMPPVQAFDHQQLIEGGWPAATVDKWKSKSETEIKRAVAMYAPLANADADALIQAASTMGPTAREHGLLGRLHTITRESRPFPIETTCYRAVQSWLLAAGFVSLPWYLRSSVTAIEGQMTDANCVAAQLLRIFPQGRMIDVSVNFDRFDPNPGDIVYMYRSHANGTPKAGGQLGHWMVMGAGGSGYGCNNFTEDEALGTAGAYATCQVRQQIQAMRRGRIQPNVADHHFVRIFDPRLIEP